MKYSLSTDANDDLHKILDYFSQRDKKLVMDFIEDLRGVCAMLSDMPEMACEVSAEMSKRLSILTGVRRWQMKKFKNYTIFYKKQKGWILILRVIDGRRDVPNLLNEWTID